MSTQTSKAPKVNKSVCRKMQGIAEEGNTCLQTPGTCESCPEWSRKRRVRAIRIGNQICSSCGKSKAKRKGKYPAPITLILGRDFASLCMSCAKKAVSALDVAIESIESKYRREKP